ncbi:MAG TPA: C4-type zinc ribbon domain-containing protein [Pyrinomonadaceae bacterium]|nr:C4-type zinc ribbon domain-containing protein [Pyrinomonadaceae bacterium]
MKSELEKLIELQKTDTNIRRLKKSIQSADERRASIEQEFEQHAFEIREIQNKSEAAKAERAALEKNIAEQKTYLERAERNLKNSQNQKEYETAMREADALQKQISAIENQVLEKMAIIEEVEKTLAERSEEISSLEGNQAKAVADFESELSKNKAELAKELKERDVVFQTLPKTLAGVYDRLAQRSRDGIAVAEVKNGSCSACFMSLRPQVLVEIKMSDKIMTCESCTRILYIVKRESAS